MIRISLLVAAALSAATAWAATSTASDPPKLSSRPLSPYSPQSIITIDEKAAFEKSQGAIGNVVSDYAMLNRDGKPVRIADYRGKPLLVNFIYTGCFQVCPTTTKNLQKAVDGLVDKIGAERFNIVSIGFNQPFDAPETMKAFARQQSIHLGNWDFLSPAEALVPELTRDFGFSFVRTASGFDHLNQVTLVDSRGRIVRQIYGELLSTDMLADPLQTLLDGGEVKNADVNLADIMDRVRILCSVYDPTTGKYRVSYAVILEIAGAVTSALWLAIFFWRDRRAKKNRSA